MPTLWHIHCMYLFIDLLNIYRVLLLCVSFKPCTTIQSLMFITSIQDKVEGLHCFGYYCYGYLNPILCMIMTAVYLAYMGLLSS